MAAASFFMTTKRIFATAIKLPVLALAQDHRAGFTLLAIYVLKQLLAHTGVKFVWLNLETDFNWSLAITNFSN